MRPAGPRVADTASDPADGTGGASRRSGRHDQAI